MDVFTGQILLVAFDFAPPDFALCNGRVLPIAANLPLFSLIGAKFGGDGATTFALPDYSTLAPKGSTYIIALQNTKFPTR